MVSRTFVLRNVFMEIDTRVHKIVADDIRKLSASTTKISRFLFSCQLGVANQHSAA